MIIVSVSLLLFIVNKWDIPSFIIIIIVNNKWDIPAHNFEKTDWPDWETPYSAASAWHLFSSSVKETYTEPEAPL